GMKTTVGFPPFADYVAKKDSPVVARLKAAGAILIGKTNVATMLGDWQSDNPLFGRTGNPWNLSRTAGGSSG
ncbi:MAG: amidase, partial [Mesorhizobium sp.]